MKNKKAAAILLALALAFSAAGCGAASSKTGGVSLSDSLTQAVSSSKETAVETAADEAALDELFTRRDLSGEYDEAVTVTLSGSAASADGAGVEIADGLVTISAAGSYLLTGSFDGRIEIRAGGEDKVQLVLSDAEISSNGAAAICAISADKLFLTLAEGTANSVSASGELAEIDGVNADGAIFAKCDLTVNGAGSLTVECETGHGLVSKDDLKIASAALTIEAAKQGLSGKDSVSIASGTLAVTSGTDGIHSENADDAEKGQVSILGGTLSIVSGSDGIDATGCVSISDGALTLSCGDDGVHADATLTVSGGSVTVSRSYEGLEAKDIVLSGGEIDITASDDGLNAAGGADNSGWGGRGGDMFAAQDVSLTISGGTLRIDAGGDGIDSNGALTVSGGTVLISGPTNGGNGAIDYNGSGVITGGTLVAAGASGMAENFGSGSMQPSMLVTFNGTLSAGSRITVTDASGKEILSFTPEKSYQCALISCPELKVGETYTVTAGTQSQSVSFSSVIYGSGSGMGGFGGPGVMGGFHGGQSGMTPPGGFDDGQSGMTPPDGFDGSFPGGDFGGFGEAPGDLPEGFDPDDLPEGFGGFGDWNGETDAVTSATPSDGGEGGFGGRGGRPGGGRDGFGGQS